MTVFRLRRIDACAQGKAIVPIEKSGGGLEVQAGIERIRYGKLQLVQFLQAETAKTDLDVLVSRNEGSGELNCLRLRCRSIRKRRATVDTDGIGMKTALQANNCSNRLDRNVGSACSCARSTKATGIA